LACGTPVISSPRGALPEIIEQGRHGFLVNNIEEGVAAVKQLDTINRTECRERFEQAFSSKFISEKYLGLYDKLIHQHATRA
ncbi:MAG TPA: glycosyltransferase, partial [Arenimonas sp.]|nr:glycosyltransferase [Arenimonas sp.]